ncbi:VOC family protein [Actinoplanes couchii]|uniref:Glyoxalase n=2 Tax=Actinoplanes couchii TaxID=403638 RepID=A0ABQ3X3K6_9ACTN|nr:glyoxalase [Actinoplanes couchii]
MTAVNGIGWFQIGTDQPAEAERFYGGLFGWTFTEAVPTYKFIKTPGEDGIPGGLADTSGGGPNHAVFSVLVADVDATCAAAEAAGGKVLVKRVAAEGTSIAHLLDPAGNQFQIFKPPAA